MPEWQEAELASGKISGRKRPLQPRINGEGLKHTRTVTTEDYRRDARVAEGGALLRRYTAYTRIEGSNPSLSAKQKRDPLRVLFLLAQ